MEEKKTDSTPEKTEQKKTPKHEHRLSTPEPKELVRNNADGHRSAEDIRRSHVELRISENFSRSSSIEDGISVESKRSAFEKSRSSSVEDKPIVEIAKFEKRLSRTSFDDERIVEARSPEVIRYKTSRSSSREEDRPVVEVNRVNAEVNRLERNYSRSNSIDEKEREVERRRDERKKDDKERRLQQNAVEIRPVTVSLNRSALCYDTF